ncbi:hypothetical protein GGR31_002567 [Mesonia maritima]|uniref:Uncharacterized protein n=1 Tax=Mesonia maritima TaxID=1793873 RepID=A0ABU1K8F3_9FLAO|nr:hypothetical protein [Mesonia maritima]
MMKNRCNSIRSVMGLNPTLIFHDFFGRWLFLIAQINIFALEN